MKFCKECKEFKPHDLTKEPRSKASGFMGWVCWVCYTTAQRTKMRERGVLAPADRTYEAMVRKAQSALDKLATMPDMPNVIHQRKALEYELERAKLKVTRFGPNAYDFTQAELKKMAKSDND